MCLAILGKILEINDENVASIDFDGIIRNASLDMLTDAKIGDYVLVHAGFAIEIINNEEAQKTINLIQELNNA